MNGTTKTVSVGGREVIVYLPQNCDPAHKLPLILLNAGDEWLEQQPEVMDVLEPLMGSEIVPFAVAAVLGADWERDFTPWPAEALSKKTAPFGGELPQYLRFVTDELIPYLANEFPVDVRPETLGIAGYSLGGLAALWMAYQTDLFGLVGSMSGSLWYDNWSDYAANHTLPNPSAKVYLSLGSAERKNRNPRMQSIAESTEQTVELLAKQLPADRLKFEWNEGGHFTEVPSRFVKALRFLFAK